MTALGENQSVYRAECRDRVFQLGDWQVDPTRNLIAHIAVDGHIAFQRQLEPRLVHLLCLLAEASGQVLTRDTLIGALWPDVIVTENSLTRAISDLRRLLAEPGESRSELIETVPKRGYRLNLPPVAPDNPSSSVEKRSTTAFTERLRHWAPAMAASVVLIVSVLVQVTGSSDAGPISAPDSSTMAQDNHWQDAVVNISSRFPIIPPRLTSLQQAPVFSGFQSINDSMPDPLSGATHSVITPDGSLIAFVEQHNGISRLGLQATRSGEAPWTAFTTDAQIYHLQWSPLDAGLLFTVGVTAHRADQPAYLRLMLLDLESLVIHELYRRDFPEQFPDKDRNAAGSLT